eukprot:15367153-Ditylum_brightwellii.AAC.3
MQMKEIAVLIQTNMPWMITRVEVLMSTKNPVLQTPDTSSSQEHLFSSRKIETKPSLRQLPTKEINPTVNIANDILAVYGWTQEQCTSLEDFKGENSCEEDEEHPEEYFADNDSEYALEMLLRNTKKVVFDMFLSYIP